MVVALKIVHIALAAAWFGHKLLIPGDLRAALRSQPPHTAGLVARLKRAETLGQVTGIGTLLAGTGLAYAVDASTVGLGVWIGASLVLAMIGVGAIFARPASNRLRDAVTSGDRVEATVAGNQLSRILGVESLLWIGALTGMVLA